ncbi:MAG: histidine kinase N-terminal 7TM domain-containing protein, partial [Pseudomonadota bacterium]
MSFQFHPILPFFIAGLFIGVGVAIYAFRYPESSVSNTFGWMTCGFILWTTSHAFEIATIELEYKLDWFTLKHVANAMLHPFWLVLCLQLTRREGTRLSLILKVLLIIWVITNIAVIITNDHHQWMWKISSSDAILPPGALIPVIETGFYYDIYTAGLALVILTSVMLYTEHYANSSDFFQRRTTLMIVASLVPLVGRTIESIIGEHLPASYVDYEVLFAMVSGVLMFQVVFGFSRLTILPIAHNLVLRDMKAGIIILDKDQRVIELNPYAQRFTSFPKSEFAGRKAEELFLAWPKDFKIDEVEAQEVELFYEGKRWCFFAQISRIQEEDSPTEGYGIVFFD